MDTQLIRITNARVLTMGGVAGPVYDRERTGEVAPLDHADVEIHGNEIAGISLSSDRIPPLTRSDELKVIDAAGRVLMPGFVDCHTHACWAGSRLDEWQARLSGASYQEIAAAGGGIMHTVRAVRAASEEQLFESLRARSWRMVRLGTTTIEVKTGYGLDAENELKMLSAIHRAGSYFEPLGVTLVPTALVGHAIDPDFPGGRRAYIQHVCDEVVPAMQSAHSRSFLSTYPMAFDAFCEKGAWTLEECLQLFASVRKHAPAAPIRVHADQFTSLGMIKEAIRLGARSVDHLEASSEKDLRILAGSGTFAVILPACGFHLDGRYADGASLILADSGDGNLCIASNFNPGSAPSPSVPNAIALAVRHCGVNWQSAIVATTRNPAALLGFSDRGYIGGGARADLILLRHTDERALAYEFGDNPVDLVIAGGRIIE